MSDNPRVNRSLERVERVLRSLDERDGPVRDAARRERQRLNRDFTRRFARVGVAVGVISLLTIVVGLIMPIGMFGFLAAVGLAIGIGALLAFKPTQERAAAAPSTDLDNAEMVQRFDSYIFRSRRAFPPPAQSEIDQISAVLPSLKRTLERLEPLDPNAQDARRLMSIHLPGLIDRYVSVPSNYRSERDGEGKTVDERLVEGLAAGRTALQEIGEKIVRSDIAALETQGRFMKTRYGEERIES
jgi:hypothetical protein